MSLDKPYRNPPLPRWYYSDNPGQCRFCGGLIIEDAKLNRRKRWHPACAHTWAIMNSSNYARQMVRQRDQEICALCGKKAEDGRWHVDHIVPLHRATGPEHWQLGNLQTACHACHHSKTMEERAEREAGREADKELET